MDLRKYFNQPYLSKTLVVLITVCFVAILSVSILINENTQKLQNQLPQTGDNNVMPSIKDQIAPQVALLFPQDGDSFATASNITVSSFVADDKNLSKIDFYINNQLLCSKSIDGKSGNYTCDWSVPNLPQRYIVKVIVYDAANNFAQVLVKTYSGGINQTF